MFTYLFDGFLRRVFSLLQAGGFIYIALAWRHRFFLSKILSASSPGVWHEIRPICSPRHRSSKLIFFHPISAGGKKVPLPFYGSGQSFRFFLLPCQAIASDYYMSSISLLYPSGHRVQTSVGFHSDPHSLLSPTGRPKLTYITIPLFSGLLIQTRRGRGHSLFLSSLSGRPRDSWLKDSYWHAV